MPFKILSSLVLSFLFLSLQAQKGAAADPYILEPSPTTVAWGYYWSETPPALHIRSGDFVRIHTLLTSNPERLEAAGLPPDQVEKELRGVQSVKDKGPGGHVLTGPVYIDGAEPGDVLEVRFDSIRLAIPYGYNAIGQNGFLSDEIFDRKMRLITLDTKKMTGHFSDGIDIPLHPFFGSAGVAPPKEAGRWNSAPPWIHAGNLDNKELVEGSSLFIPVHVKGALFEIGDGHAAQGNGEVDITAIETSLIGKLQFTVHKGRTLHWPRAETSTHIITMGCDRDLNAATHIAVREMISYLVEEKKMSQADAYMLCSVAVDVDITQLVDGNVGVHAMLPKSIFVK
ncbi:acetamidase/formamidase family protein [Flavitalea sp. BT771]|uniref:acetamidase/formamidase family protein n=1 Tax=Flavitalea sp. BT771 TaxID=3063329 RepID=UPI0026E309AF|nr:acetamidase/formamidase family protein [Flavitalea sp. BT771]MDO6430450.1 acetamidase/formamidase family protein [Flavitalea sp. BT771]MDV6219410.1 acetamidase/formamidase family protein [Flavitalea sp. BT771]